MPAPGGPLAFGPEEAVPLSRSRRTLAAVLAALAIPALAGAVPAAHASGSAGVDDVLRREGYHLEHTGPEEQEVRRCGPDDLEVCEMFALAEGAEGRAVRHLQGLLYLKRFYRGEIDGVFDRDVAVAVATFHKTIEPPRSDDSSRWQAVANWQDNPPSEVFLKTDWALLNEYQPIPPKARVGQPDRVEVDIGRQLLYLVLDGRVDAIVHVSTGYNPYHTPRTGHRPDGSYFYTRHSYDGWSPEPGLWSIYKFWAYIGRDNNYGVHGYRQVPYFPASHGCIRVHVWDADYLHERFFLGMPVHVWDE